MGIIIVVIPNATKTYIYNIQAKEVPGDEHNQIFVCLPKLRLSLGIQVNRTK